MNPVPGPWRILYMYTVYYYEDIEMWHKHGKDSFIKFKRNKTLRGFLLKIDWSEIQRTPRIHFDSVCKCIKQEQTFKIDYPNLFKNRR